MLSQPKLESFKFSVDLLNRVAKLLNNKDNKKKLLLYVKYNFLFKSINGKSGEN